MFKLFYSQLVCVNVNAALPVCSNQTPRRICVCLISSPTKEQPNTTIETTKKVLLQRKKTTSWWQSEVTVQKHLFRNISTAQILSHHCHKQHLFRSFWNWSVWCHCTVRCFPSTPRLPPVQKRNDCIFILESEQCWHRRRRGCLINCAWQ